MADCVPYLPVEYTNLFSHWVFAPAYPSAPADSLDTSLLLELFESAFTPISAHCWAFVTEERGMLIERLFQFG